MISLVDPVSTGVELARAFREEGADCVHVYAAERKAAYDDDPAPHRVLHHDLDATERELRKLGVRTIMAASEFGVTLADELAERLGLPHHDPALRAARRDKDLMMQALQAAGVSCLDSESVSTAAALAGFLDGAPAYPLVVKPRNSAGTDGCTVCPDRAAAEAAFTRVIGERNLIGEVNESVLVQEFLAGNQYVVNTVSMAGRHLLTEVYGERIDRIDGVPVLRHMLSLRALCPGEQEVVDYTFACLDALGIKEGAAHTEVMLTPAGPRLVEVNSRVMGPCLDPDPYHAAFGYSHQHLVVERFLRPAEFEHRFTLGYQPAAAVAKVYLRPAGEGILRSVGGLRILRRMPGFHSVARLPEIGLPVPDRYLTTGASGIAFLVHEDTALLEHVLESLHELEDAGEFYRLEEPGQR
ncbi:ATP-grasp domain-containing protein [Streptomyces sp. NBC_01635]|uniref:ATP-grasp domain-containing protein n=1 Tax=Streptomyces sp. NBC_01635 TaxID=2975904 RepID=UPI00386AA3FC|nr:ATP-grasp domain-containing protein [Streptomyces sp. NBC_01635]